MTVERLQLCAVAWCLAGKDGQWQGGMDDAWLGPLSALQLMEEKSDHRHPPREYAWACCQASFLHPALVLSVREKPCLGLLLGWDKLGESLAGGAGPLQVAVLTGNPKMAPSTLASGLGQAWAGCSGAHLSPLLAHPGSGKPAAAQLGSAELGGCGEK